MDPDTTNPFDLSGLGPLGFDAPPADAGLPADPAILERNLIALMARNRPLGERLGKATARCGLQFEMGADGLVSATLDGRRLSSARRGADEAARFAETVDPAETAAACVIGFGLGHHVRGLQQRMGSRSVVVCFEPDLGLLRAVFERVDHSAWLALGRCVIATDADDAAGLSRSLEKCEALLAVGVKIVEHAPSAARIGEAGVRFGRTLGEVVRSNRTHVVTSLVHAPVTLRNMLMNAERYATCAGITALKDACPGAAAVTVAAGPSLRRNLHLLAEPGLRDRVVIIAAQTVLKPMLAAGIKPHFVTALDHHEMSARFYEGLTAADVRGVRLVVEPKANPAILDAFPGEILCTEESLLDQLIGPGLARPMGAIDPGSTVAHLSYALARHLGCDPVIMIGQDLAFTDGQYYAANAAIHDVWQGELNGERTLEMLEWERVARMRANLRKVADQRGGRVYTDEQMSTYLAQFEADFQRDTEAGLTVIDATEGGARKQYASVMTLAGALTGHAKADRPALPETAHLSRDAGTVRPALRAHLGLLREQADTIAHQGRLAEAALQGVLDAGDDARRADRLIRKVHAMRDIVTAQQPGFALVEFINQTGALNRFKADRLIALHDASDTAAHRRLHAERDIKNVVWIAEAAEDLSKRIAASITVLDGLRSKLTREDPPTQAVDASSAEIGVSNPELFILCDPDCSGLGVRRDLAEPVWRGRNALALTLGRALRCQSVRRVRVLTPEPERTRVLIDRAGLSGRVEVEPVDRARWRDRARAIGVARAPAADCWRGGAGQTTVFDEQLDPGIIADVMQRRGVDACAVASADAVLLDPVLVDALVERHATNPSRYQLCFSQAAPGLGAVVLGREAVDSLVTLQNAASPLATVGGLLGYLPVSPQADPISTPLCVKVDPCVRDLGRRVLADASPGRALVAAALDSLALSDEAGCSTAERTARVLAEVKAWKSPRTLVLELCPGRLASGPFGGWKRGGAAPHERVMLDLKAAHDLVRQHTRAREDAVLLLDGPGDPLMHPQALDVVRLADEMGAACVHLRTDLLWEGDESDALADCGLGILSVDLLANDPKVYAGLTGLDRHRSVLERLGAIADARAVDATGLKAPWVLPRMTRCAATLDEVESFYDRWIMTLGAAVIDPLPAWAEDDARPLPVPTLRQAQLGREIVRVRSDGLVCDERWRSLGVNALHDGLADAFKHARSAAQPGYDRPGAHTSERGAARPFLPAGSAA